MNELPNCLLKYLLLFCHKSYHTLRCVNHLFAKIIPIRMARHHGEPWQILQPVAIISDYSNYLPNVTFLKIKAENIDLSTLSNLRKLELIYCREIIFGNNLEEIEYYGDNCNYILQQLPITIKKIQMEFGCFKKFINLEELRVDKINCDLRGLTKLRKINGKIGRQCQLPSNVKTLVTPKFKNIELPDIEILYLYFYNGEKLPISLKYLSIYTKGQWDFSYLTNLQRLSVGNNSYIFYKKINIFLKRILVAL